MKPTLYILCGIPGCGKSTWANNFIKAHCDVRYISRDNIRLEILKENENYFAHEDIVFKNFISYLTQILSEGHSVIADATHLNYSSRKKLTRAIDKHFMLYRIVYVIFEIPLFICIERNNKRKGRAKVPETVIKDMNKNFFIPNRFEDAREIGRIILQGDIYD